MPSRLLPNPSADLAVWIVMPALDEEASIGRVLEALPTGVRVVVCDNGSTDRTAEVARENGADVISCSWGVAAEFYSLSTSMIDVIRRAAREGRNGRGCVIVFASGNDDSPVDGYKNGVRAPS